MVLNELLLAASGHRSSLECTDSTLRLNTLKSRLSPSENALISRVIDNGLLLSTIKIQAKEVSSSHPSTICRAVASATLSPHLTSFHEHIINIERQILQHEPQFVGAYGIVPLSGIVASLDNLPRRLEVCKIVESQDGVLEKRFPEIHIYPGVSNTRWNRHWLKRLMGFLRVEDGMVNGNLRGLRSGSQLINWLRRESQTGYPDVEHLILQLISVAESSWLRQTSMWLLYGDLPSPGQHADFFIQPSDQTKDSEPTGEYVVLTHFAPEFVTCSTARSIRFIGTSLNHMKEHINPETGRGGLIETWTNRKLLTKNLKLLSDLQYPLTALRITQVVMLIRNSLAQTALRNLLPTEKTVQTLSVLYDFLLMNRHEFAPCLVSVADEYLAARNSAYDPTLRPDTHRLQGIMIRHGELKALLSKAIGLVTLRNAQNMGREAHDENVEIVRDQMSLSVRNIVADNLLTFRLQTDITKFDDMLIGTPTVLNFKLVSPMTLILSQEDIMVYSRIGIYLLSIRRAHMHLADSWRLSTLRRVHTRRPNGSRKVRTDQTDPEELRDVYENSILLRRIWTTVSSAAFFFAQLSLYLHEEVLANSWINFHRWLEPSSTTPYNASNRVDISGRDHGIENRTIIHDAQTISNAHKQYLSCILSQIFLSDSAFMTNLRVLCSRVDAANSLMTQINSITEVALAASSSLSSTNIPQYLSKKEHSVLSDLRETEIAIRDSLNALLARLKSLDSEFKDGSDSASEPEEDDTTGFVPWRSLGVSSLLVKLGLGEDDWLEDKKR